MYNHNNQYRCEIIRGKSKSQMDYLLPAYASVIHEVCPCSSVDFETLFNDAFAVYLPVSERKKKTFDNHRTEISGKLFGMYYSSDDGRVYESQRNRMFLEDQNLVAFFKDICYKMQFPNGMQKTKPTVLEKVNAGISLRPNAFVLKTLLVAKENQFVLSQTELAYYVLNSLDVLRGQATPYEVVSCIIEDSNQGIIRTISCKDKNGKEKAYSYRYQHIREQLNYLEMANLITLTDYNGQSDKKVVLNIAEMPTIELFASEWNLPPAFNVYQYDLSTVESRKAFQTDWDLYYSQTSKYAQQFWQSERN